MNKLNILNNDPGGSLEAAGTGPARMQRATPSVQNVQNVQKAQIPRKNAGSGAPNPLVQNCTKCSKIPEPADAQKWREALADLAAIPAPTGFSSPRWSLILDAADGFLEDWAAAAIACGWSTLDAFGCDPDRPAARFDCMGLVLLLDRCRIVAVDEAGADLETDTGARQRFRRRPLPAHTVPLWRLSK